MEHESERPVELGKDRPRVQDAVEPGAGVPPQAPVAGSVPPPPVWAEQPWGGIESPGAQLPPYPPPPPVAQPMFPAPGYPRAGYGVPPYGPPQRLPPRYGYVDTTPIWSVLSFCCVAASLLGGALMCGLPILVTVPTGVVLGVVGHTKGEPMGKWAAIANGAIGALAVLAVVVFIVALGA